MLVRQYEILKNFIKNCEEILDNKGLSCTKYNCLCGQYYAFCPFESDTESVCEQMDCT